jgi:NAD(P)-dependent dehydrogenase (short-subunit alcohol dehydrogenase family)
MSLTGPRTLITAGAAGIGRRMVDHFADAGAQIVVCDVDEAALAQLAAERPEVTSVKADIADEADVERLFEAVTDTLGGLDNLIANAGISGPAQPVEDITLDDWRRTMAVNIDGMFLCVRAGVPLLKQAGGGSIITLSSAAGKFAYPLRTPYSASKWAVVGFTKTLAAELGAHAIRANSLLPGVVEGARIDRVIHDKANARGVPAEDMRAQYEGFASLKTMIPGDDIAAMALYLCSEAGQRISGQAISIDGDIQSLA